MESIMFEPLEEPSHNIEDGEEISYGELYASALLNGEIIITIPLEEETKTKNGIKNFKSKQNQKLKEEGQPADQSTISFSSSLSTEFEGCIDLSIAVQQRGTVKIKAMRIPGNHIPD